MRGNGAVDIAVSGYSIVNNMITEFLAALDAWGLDHMNRELAKMVHKQFQKNARFSEKAEMVRNILKETMKDDPETLQHFLRITDQIAAENQNVENGFSTIRRLVKHMPKEDRDAIFKMLDDAQASLQNPNMVMIAPNVASALQKQLQKHDMAKVCKMYHVTNGMVAVFFLDEAKTKLRDLLAVATLECGNYHGVTKEDLETKVLARCLDRSKISELIFEHVPRELAEKMTRESEKRGIVTFAMEPEVNVLDPATIPSHYRLICYGGEDDAERDEIFTEANRIAALSALSLSGKVGKLEKKRMNHFAIEDINLRNAIESIGEDTADNETHTVYLISENYAWDPKKPNNLGSRNAIDIIGRVQFDCDHMNVITPNGNVNTVYADPNRSFKTLIKYNVNANALTRVLVSKNEEAKIEAKQLSFSEILNEVSTSGTDREEQLNGLLNKVNAELDQLPQNDTSESRRALLNRKQDIQEVISLVAEYGPKEAIPPESIHLAAAKDVIRHSEHLFHPYEAASKLDAHDMTIEADFITTECGRIEKELKEFNIENRLPLSTSKEEFSTKPLEAKRLIEAVSQDAYVTNRFECARPDGSEGPGITVSDVREMDRYLSENLSDMKSSATNLLDGITVKMQSIEAPMLNTLVNTQPSQDLTKIVKLTEEKLKETSHQYSEVEEKTSTKSEKDHEIIL